MKKFIYVLLAAVGVVLLSIVSSLGYNHYVSSVYPELTEEDTIVGVQVSEAVTQVINPTFKSVGDVFQFREREAEQDSIDATFFSIPPDVLTNIAQVVIGRDGQADKKSIVKEYNDRYRQVYKYLPPNPPAYTAVPETIKTPPSIERDTIINGQVVKIIKEIKNE